MLDFTGLTQGSFIVKLLSRGRDNPSELRTWLWNLTRVNAFLMHTFILLNIKLALHSIYDWLGFFPYTSSWSHKLFYFFYMFRWLILKRFWRIMMKTLPVGVVMKFTSLLRETQLSYHHIVPIQIIEDQQQILIMVIPLWPPWAIWTLKLYLMLIRHQLVIVYSDYNNAAIMYLAVFRAWHRVSLIFIHTFTR